MFTWGVRRHSSMYFFLFLHSTCWCFWTDLSYLYNVLLEVLTNVCRLLIAGTWNSECFTSSHHLWICPSLEMGKTLCHIWPHWSLSLQKLSVWEGNKAAIFITWQENEQETISLSICHFFTCFQLHNTWCMQRVIYLDCIIQWLCYWFWAILIWSGNNSVPSVVPALAKQDPCHCSLVTGFNILIISVFFFSITNWYFFMVG